MGQGQTPKHPLQPSITPPQSAAPADAPGRHLGDLARSDQRWAVYLETQPHEGVHGFRGGEAVAGRLHFIDGSRRRATAWIFLEWNDQAVLERFNEFSPIELWKMVESLG
jgi:hypothetical protein